MAEFDKQEIKHFWGFVVWNYKAEQIQILELTQISIMNPIKDLTKNEDWGDPTGYDITITKEGENMETKYRVTPSPHSKISEIITDVYKDTTIKLEALFTGADPFEIEKSKEKAVEVEEEKMLDIDDIQIG